VKVSGTYFYTRIKDEITYLPTDDFGAPVYYNADRHYSRGAEFSGSVRPTRSTDIFASYTFTNSDVRNFNRPFLVPVAKPDRKAFGIPDHQFTLVVTQRIKRFWVSLDVLATSSYLAPVSVARHSASTRIGSTAMDGRI
jgi:outer membrane receptor protein involved in Fe transport